MLWLSLCLIMTPAENIFFPKAYQNDYSNYRLVNGLEVLIVSCSTCHEAGASLSVFVGSNQDTVPGITHLLEHMIFFSSQTYPEEDYLMKFVNLNGGYSNAYTDSQYTNFYYSISNLALEESLKIFSSAFIAPIFSIEAVNREIKAVNSEHLKNVYNDDWRKFRILQVASGKDPISNFPTGNAKTLAIPKICELVESHFFKFYLAGQMKLVIYGNFSIEALTGMSKLFESIRPGTVLIENDEIIIEKEKIYVARMVDEGISLELHWEIPNQLLYVDSQSGYFISYLLSNQGEYSFMADFEEIQKFSAEISTFPTFSLFSLKFALSSESRLLLLVSSLLGFIEKISMYSEKDLQTRWDDYSQIKSNTFEYSDKLTPERFASRVSANMFFFPHKLYYSGFDLAFTFNYQEIQKTLTFFTSKSLIAILISSNFFDQANILGTVIPFSNYCEYYNLHYGIGSFPIPFVNKNYYIYPRNPYIPIELKLYEQTEVGVEKVFSDLGCEMWVSFGNIFSTPKTIINLLLFEYPWNEVQVNLEVVLKTAEITMRKRLYLYEAAGYTAEFDVEFNGATVKVQGWSEGIVEYLEKVIECIFYPDLREMPKALQETHEKYSAFLTEQPYIQTEEYLRIQILQSYYSTTSKLQYLSSITSLPIEIPSLSLRILITGNISKAFSLEILNKILKSFQFSKSNFQIPNTFPINSSKINKHTSPENHSLLTLYDFGSFDLNTWAKIIILTYFADDLAFRVLRTQEQLGYIVFIKPCYKYFRNSFALVIQGPDKTPDEMEKSVENFWNRMDIDEKILENLKKQVAQKLLWPQESLEGQNFEFWKEITSGRLEFTIAQRLSAEVSEISLEEILEILLQIRLKSQVVEVRIYKEEISEILILQD